MSPRIELGIVIEIAVGVSWDVGECFEVLVCPLTMAESEQIERDLSMSQFDARVLEESICRIEQVKSLSARLLILLSLSLQLWMSQNHLRNLEEDHLTTDCLDDAVR